MADSAERCISALRCAKSDTEKFAALLLITKVVKAQDCDRESRRRIFNAVGFDFVSRLLNTDDVPEGCPPYIYKAIALTLLSCFCTEPELIRSPEMLDNVSHLADFVVNSGQSTDEQMMVTDAILCLSSIAACSEGCSELVDREVMPKLCQAIIENKFGCERVFNLVYELVSNVGNECWNKCPLAFHALMNKLASDFVIDNSDKKFDLCQKLTVFVLNAPCKLSESCDTVSWAKDVSKGLSDILFSKVSVPQMNRALKLGSAMIDKFGVRWALGNIERGKQFFLIFCHLTCIEVRMILEERTLDQVLEDSALLVACFTSLENIIAFLITCDQTTVEIDLTQRQQLYSALTAAMNAVLTFIYIESRMIESLSEFPESKKHLVVSCVRVTGAWLAEETYALKENVYDVLPFLLKVASHTCDEIFAGKDELDVLRFLLPGLCHLSAEDKSRNLITEQKFHERLLSYFAHVWKKFVNCSPHEEAELKSTIATICGIFMNIIVLDALLISKDETFHQLLHFIFRALPELECKVQYLVLIGNLSVLGLLLLRHFASRVKSCETLFYKYLSSSIKFLWDAHNIEDSNDYNSVVIAQEYKRVWNQIMELWFLGMQALATLLKELPWIGQFILESGWISVILGTLKKIEGGAIDASTKSAYENFLCCLVPSAKCIRQVFVDEGALDVCATHKMKELETMLTGQQE